jgi:hypothetical protein
MYIVNPLAARGGGASSLWSTHPDTGRRVQILRSMAGGAAYAQYEQAYRKVTKGSGLIGQSALVGESDVAIREASAEPERAAPARRREAMDAIHRLEGYEVAACQCGTRIKVPPVYKKPAIGCPSCGRMVAVGQKDGGTETPSPAGAKPRTVQLQSSGWTVIDCPCGATIPVSPAFGGKRLSCKKCGQPFQIKR